METFTKFDASDYLDSEEMIAEYLTAALEDSNPDVFLAALADVATARGMSAIAKLPEPLLREVGDFVDFLLARHAQETQPVSDEVPASLLARLAVAGGSFDWLDDPAEDIYSDADGESVYMT